MLDGRAPKLLAFGTPSRDELIQPVPSSHEGVVGALVLALSLLQRLFEPLRFLGLRALLLMVRLDAESKQALIDAAELRRISVSDYVRTVTVAQARREVASARDQTILLSPDEQLAFWQALQAPPKLTPAQKQLGAIMRGQK